MLNDDLITHPFNWFGFWVGKPVSIIIHVLDAPWHTRGESLAHQSNDSFYQELRNHIGFEVLRF